MKYIYLMLISTLSFSTMSIAKPLHWNNINSPDESQNYYEQQSQNYYEQQKQQSQQNYTSSYGNSYKYDLSKGSDRLRYSTDVGAQFRDQKRLPSPSLQMERRQGQYGGGYISE